MYHNRLSMQDSYSLGAVMLLTWGTKKEGWGGGGGRGRGWGVLKEHCDGHKTDMVLQ